MVFANIYAPNKVRDQCTYFKDWKEIYCIPFRVAIDSRTHKFQFKESELFTTLSGRNLYYITVFHLVADY